MEHNFQYKFIYDYIKKRSIRFKYLDQTESSL